MSEDTYGGIRRHNKKDLNNLVSKIRKKKGPQL